MTLVSLCSLKGAPGVTTLSCLLGAAWPGPGPVTLVEADPAGGDLAARFGLSARVGWSSLAQSGRRSDEPSPVDGHLQTLPGGLPVLVAARGDERGSATSDEGLAVRSGPAGAVVRSGPAGPVGTVDATGTPGARRGLTIVDLGRLAPADNVSGSWLACSDAVLLVVRGDSSSAVRLRDRAGQLADTCHGRLGVVVVGGERSSQEIAGFARSTAVVPMADVPFDPAAARMASGDSGAGRRFERSPLWLATVRLAEALDAQLRGGGDGAERPGRGDGAVAVTGDQADRSEEPGGGRPRRNAGGVLRDRLARDGAEDRRSRRVPA